MKFYALLFGLFLFSAIQASAHDSCTNNEKFKQRVDFENGQVLFVEPGLYTSGKSYRAICEDGLIHDPSTECRPEADKACEYLGFKRAFSVSAKYEYDEASYIFFHGKGGYSFSERAGQTKFISDLVCE